MNLLERELLPGDALEVSEVGLVGAGDGGPAADEAAPVAGLGGGAEVAAAGEEGALAARDALGEARAGLEPGDGGLEVAPVRRHEDYVSGRGRVLGRPGGADPGGRVRGQARRVLVRAQVDGGAGEALLGLLGLLVGFVLVAIFVVLVAVFAGV